MASRLTVSTPVAAPIPWRGASASARTPSAAAVQRVLVFRSCRLPLFVDTVAWVGREWPGAQVDVLTSPGFDEAIRETGACRIVHYAGSRLGVVRQAAVLRRLRRERYDAVVVPQMTASGSHYANLHRAALAVGAKVVALVVPDHPPIQSSREEFLWFACRMSLGRLLRAMDIPLLITLLVVACVWRRHQAPRAGGRCRVLHVITTFGVGGAQVQLAELLARTPADQYDVDVLVLAKHDGEFSRQWLKEQDIAIRYATAWPLLSLTALEIAGLCRTGRYDLVHTWLFMANVIGAAGARLGGRARVIGSVRNLSLWKRTWYARWWFRVADALAARAADRVTVNATPLVADHAAWAVYPARRLVVVPNGLDPARVLPHAPGASARLRESLGVAPDTPIVGTVGRLAPEKDHAMFLEAVALARRLCPNLHAVLVGDGERRVALEARARELGLDGHVHFMGERSDSRRIIAGLDLFMLTSRIEGFPNVLLEAAFLGVPAVATDVGGAGDVLGPDGLVQLGDTVAASEAIVARLTHPETSRLAAAVVRRRALEQFTAERTTARWLSLYDDLLNVKEIVCEN